MTRSVVIRRARETDAASIVSLFTTSMGRAIGSLVVMGSPSAAAYVTAAIRAEPVGGDLHHWVIEASRGGLIAFLQLRLGVQSLVLNQIHVSRAYRNHGLGTTLLHHALSATVPGAPLLAVDAFLETPRAHRFYHRLGFVEESRSYWWTERIPDHVDAAFILRNLPAADAAHAALGVSMVSIETERGVHEVGRMGSAWYRVGPDARHDPGVLTALERLDQRRRMLVIAPEPKAGPAIASRLTSVRYIAEPESVRRACLAEGSPAFVVSWQP